MKKVLIVDDEEDVDFLIQQKFRKEIQDKRLCFLFARNGRQALSLVEAHEDIDLVITDINMPAMNGIELLRRIKAYNPLTHVMVVSAYTDDHHQSLAEQGGADGFISKPIDLKSLEKIVLSLP
jgi:adenylate cyclase